MPGRSLEVVVVMQDGEAVLDRCATDQQVNDAEGSQRACSNQRVLSGIDPAPHVLGYGYIGVEECEITAHLIEFPRVAR